MSEPKSELWSDHNAHGCTDMYCHCKVPGRELKNQELPPLDVALLSEMSKRDDFMIVGSQVRHLIGMYRAASNELKAKDTELAAKDARIAELTAENVWLKEPQLESLEIAKDPKTGNMATDIRMRHPTVHVLAESLAAMLEDMNAPNFFTMELHSQKAGRLEITIQRLSGKAMSQVLSELKAKLGAVSEVLKEKLPTSPWYPEFCRLEDFNAFVAKARSIVEGKDSGPTSPQAHR